MAVARFLHKIYDKASKQYIAVGYERKASWLKFPGAAIKSNGLTDKDIEVYKFEIVEQLAGKFDVRGKEL